MTQTVTQVKRPELMIPEIFEQNYTPESEVFTLM